MGEFRAFLFRYRRIAALLIAAALCMKALVPAGYMVGQGKTFSIEICADSLTAHTSKHISVPIKDGQADAAAKAHSLCPFAGHGVPALAGADPLLLALAIAFVLALAFTPAPAPRLVRGRQILPPLRGPPARA